MFFSIQNCLNFSFPAANPDWKFPMRQTRALPACLDSQIPRKPAFSYQLPAISPFSRSTGASVPSKEAGS
jgi:hypothetical protein